MLARRRAPLLLILLTLVAVAGACSRNPAGPSGAATILVDPAGGGDYTTIQEALDAAAPGDTVLVAPGVYQGNGNRDLDFAGEAVCLRSIAGAGSTVIDCGGGARGFTCTSGEGPLSVVDGFTIRDGLRSQGGAIYCDGSSPSFRNALVIGNTATSEGGGAFLRNGSSPSFSNVRFEGNSALGFDGGGVFCLASSPSFTDVEFRANTASSGGGVHAIFSDFQISEAVFDSNSVTLSGGGLYLGGSDPALDGVVFFENQALEGAAVYCDASSPTITHTTMARNAAVTGAGVFCAGASNPTITNTVLAFSTLGGALYCSDETDLPVTTHCCVHENADDDSLCGTYFENIFVDPLFCNLNGGDLRLSPGSPCLPASNAWGERVGALGEGCLPTRRSSNEGGRL